jgi:DNA repair exonuclease SbcCD ATPase subunit
MSDHQHPIWTLLDKLQMDNREQAAKLVELRSYVANIDLPNPAASECPECGTKFRNHLVRDEHLYNAHDGPVPPHYLRAEELAGLEAQ